MGRGLFFKAGAYAKGLGFWVPGFWGVAVYVPVVEGLYRDNAGNCSSSTLGSPLRGSVEVLGSIMRESLKKPRWRLLSSFHSLFHYPYISPI